MKRRSACQQELAKQSKNLSCNQEPMNSFISDKQSHRSLDHDKLKQIDKQRPFKMMKCKDKGKSLIATRNIKAGEPILSEKAFVSVPKDLKKYCYHCLRRLDQTDQPTPCVQCCQVRYCSQSCASSSWNEYHSYECCHIDILNISPDFHYSPKLTLRAMIKCGIDKILPITGTDDDDDKSSEIPVGYNGFIDMIEHSSTDSNDYSIASAIIAAFILEKVAKQLDLVFSRNSIADLFERINKHLCQVNVNGITITNNSITHSDCIDDEAMYCESNAGCGVYLISRLINHSCDPNCRITRFENGDTLVLYATKDIDVGDEITFSYGGNYRWQIFSERQSMLKKSYFFDCNCFACENKLQPVNTALKCPTCSGSVVSDGDMICLSCGQKNHIDLSTVIAQMTDCMKIIKLGSTMMDKANDAENSIDLLEIADKSFIESYDQMINLVDPSHNEITKLLQLRLKVARKLNKLEQSVLLSENIFDNLSSQYHVTYYKVFNCLLILITHQVNLYQELKKKKPLNKNQLNAIKSKTHVNLDILCKAYVQISCGQDTVILEKIKRSCKLLSCQPLL